MSVIAWDGATLAADRMVSDSWTKCGCTVKIQRVRGCLLGCSGTTVAAVEMVAWFRDHGADPDKFPAALRATGNDNMAKMLVITPERRVLLYENSPYPMEYCPAAAPVGRCMAIGSGREAALAAMVAGADARRAVEIASVVCAGVGNGIDTLEFEHAAD